MWIDSSSNLATKPHLHPVMHSLRQNRLQSKSVRPGGRVVGRQLVSVEKNTQRWMHQLLRWTKKNTPKVMLGSPTEKTNILRWWWCFQNIGNHHQKEGQMELYNWLPQSNSFFFMGLWSGMFITGWPLVGNEGMNPHHNHVWFHSLIPYESGQPDNFSLLKDCFCLKLTSNCS